MNVAQGSIAVRQQLLDRVSDARRRSDALFKVVRPDSLYDRPIPERHRLIFYIGHLEAFDLNLLHDPLVANSVHPEFDRLFAFGIDPVDSGLPSDRPSDWPSIEAAQAYVKSVRSTLDKKLSSDSIDFDAPAREGFSLSTLLNVAIEHRLMHLETLAYLFHQLPLEKKTRIAEPVSHPGSAVEHRMIEIPAGVAKLGLSRNDNAFGWDNEYEMHETFVPAFEIDRYMVTNRQFLDFINAGGYETRNLWDDDDWNWKSEQRISHPVFWKKAGNRWLLRTLFDEIPLPSDWPVYVSHAEAEAYARWTGKRLPTEQEWHRAAFGTTDSAQRFYPWGNLQLNSRLGNFDFNQWDPTPVNAHPSGRSAFGVEGMLGNGWEWTSTKFSPFHGFEPFPFYRGYSADFFDGKHFVMKGGSAHTAECMLRPTFRNWFQSHYQYAYAGFRCVSAGV